MAQAPLILLCDHRGSGLEHGSGELKHSGFRLETTSNLRQSIARIEGDLPVLIVLNPLTSGGEVELSSIDRARSGSPAIPLLLVGDPDDPLARMQSARALDGGPWDLIWRDAPAEEWELRAERLLDVTELLGEMEELRHRAYHDDRTDLLRPRAFQSRLHEHFSATLRHKLDFAFVLIDLDSFGAINKRHDHTVGDILITQVGEVIRRTLRAEDVAGRLGGDEFAVLLPYTKEKDASLVVGRLRDEIRKLSGRPSGARDDVQVSASIGFETTNGEDMDAVETMRRHAEEALQAAKAKGGDVGVYYRDLPSQDTDDKQSDEAPQTPAAEQAESSERAG